MSKIETLDFDAKTIEAQKNNSLYLNWPAVYFLRNNAVAYIGQTTGLYARMKEHLRTPIRKGLKIMHVMTDEEYNVSAALDIESLLIQYVAAEGTYKIQNGNRGLLDHNYFDKPRYRGKFEAFWQELQSMGIVRRDLKDVKNDELFKYSPYKALTPEQLSVANELTRLIRTTPSGAHIVNGGPGTGKSVLATYLAKALKDDERTRDLKIALVISMTPLRKTLQNVFSRVEGLSSGMVIGPSEAAKQDYDVLIVDEAHRLRRRKGLTGYGAHDNTNRKLGLDKEGTELDWILKKSKHQILFYDKNQTVRPSDIPASFFKQLGATQHQLSMQLRVEGGDRYIKSIEQIFSGEQPTDTQFENYDFKIYDDLGAMVGDIKVKDKQVDLARMVAGYAWPWKSKKDSAAFDIEIGDTKLRWNSRLIDWVNSPKAIDEVGCIHTVQGYDLNYAGVIIGAELEYDPTSGLKINPKNYKDVKGLAGVVDDAELARYVLNIYKTLMTRAIKGTYVYVVNPSLRSYFAQIFNKDFEISSQPVPSPYTREMIEIPLVGSAPCGNPLLGEQNIEEYIPVEKAKIKAGFDYFILRAEGDSMNLAGINDGDLVLCRQQLKAETGDRVIALLGDNVTIKEYGPREDGVRLLLPRSTNKSHSPITPEEGDIVQGVVQDVLG